MEKPEAKKRDLLISSSISQGSVKDIVKEIFEINADDDQKEETYKDWKRAPIRLFMNSYGGSVYDGLALVDIIRHSKTPIHTICVGSCILPLMIFLLNFSRFGIPIFAILKLAALIWIR